MSETPPRPPEAWDRGDYAALPAALAAKMRNAWRRLPGTQANTPNGAPFPLRSWPPDAAIDIQALAEWVDPLAAQVVRVYANAAARDAAITAPAEGMTVWLTDLHQQQTYTGGFWAPTGGSMPWQEARNEGSFYHGANWSSLAAPAGAAVGGSGWPTPTTTTLKIPAGFGLTRVAYEISCCVVQAGIRVILGFGDPNGVMVEGEAEPVSGAGDRHRITGIYPGCNPAVEYTGWIWKGSPVDVTSIRVGFYDLGPAN